MTQICVMGCDNKNKRRIKIRLEIFSYRRNGKRAEFRAESKLGPVPWPTPLAQRVPLRQGNWFAELL